ncbi:MAG TPA: hypothetical protein VHO70_01855 [Chitinispirillaceae bacterium]|nr:hypothetical protein [Chitinispirillaceae bacterium]
MKNNKVIIAAIFALIITSIIYSGGVKKDASAGAGIETITSTTESKSSQTDTLTVKARLVEIPGKLPSNDLYNYVYIMKYRVLNVEKGSCTDQEILVGQYNPLIARNMIKDKMDLYVNGNAKKFVVGEKQILKLISPVESVWKDAIEDEYFDIDGDRYFAVETNSAE